MCHFEGSQESGPPDSTGSAAIGFGSEPQNRGPELHGRAAIVSGGTAPRAGTCSAARLESPARRAERLEMNPPGRMRIRARGARRNAGTGAVAVTIALAILCLFAVAAVPRVVDARVSANEEGAVRALELLHRAQRSLSIDEVLGKRTEFGTLSQLVEHRQLLLDESWQPDEQGIVTRGGYRFQVFVPDATGKGVAVLDGPVSAKDPARAVATWCAYAWPVKAGATGRRAFAIDRDGTVYVTENTSSEELRTR